MEQSTTREMEKKLNEKTQFRENFFTRPRNSSGEIGPNKEEEMKRGYSQDKQESGIAMNSN